MIQYREAGPKDAGVISFLPAPGESGGAPEERMRNYLEGTHHPQHALAPRVMYVALDGDTPAGYAAGHLTRRFDCDGELQWIYVCPDHRRNGIAAKLVQMLAEWFRAHDARRVCVDVAPSNAAARGFYSRCGARPFKPSWMLWDDITATFADGDDENT